MNENGWFTYIIATEEGLLYTGITTDIKRRWQQHASGKGAKYFRGRKPFCLCYLVAQENRSLASKNEAFIKALSRQQKWDLIHREYDQMINQISDETLPLYDIKTTFVQAV